MLTLWWRNLRVAVLRRAGRFNSKEAMIDMGSVATGNYPRPAMRGPSRRPVRCTLPMHRRILWKASTLPAACHHQSSSIKGVGRDAEMLQQLSLSAVGRQAARGLCLPTQLGSRRARTVDVQTRGAAARRPFCNDNFVSHHCVWLRWWRTTPLCRDVARFSLLSAVLRRACAA